MKLKQQAEDFIVEEKIKVPKGEGEYSYFWLTKTNWTTIQAIKKISDQCRVSSKRFGWAGTKDKVGITKQLVSAWNVSKEDIEKISLKDITIKYAGSGSERINLGDLKSNKFELILRELNKEDIKEINNQVTVIKKYGFPNYFGEQRFGRGNTHLIGKAILKGDLEKAAKLIISYTSNESKDATDARLFAKENWGEWKEILKKMPKWFGIEKALVNYLIKYPNDFGGAIRNLSKKLLKLYIHAYQSYLFNKILAKMVSETSKHKKMKLKNMRISIPQQKTSVPYQLELPGYATKLKNDRYSKILKNLLRRDRIFLKDFKCKSMPELKSRGTSRDTFVKVKGLRISNFEDDELNKNKKKAKITFTLDPGCYATILIRSLFLRNLN